MYIYKNRRFWNKASQNWTRNISSASNYHSRKEAENAVARFGGTANAIWLIGNRKTNVYINAVNNAIGDINQAGIWQEQEKAVNVYKHSGLAKANNMHVIDLCEFIPNNNADDASTDDDINERLVDAENAPTDGEEDASLVDADNSLTDDDLSADSPEYLPFNVGDVNTFADSFISSCRRKSASTDSEKDASINDEENVLTNSDDTVLSYNDDLSLTDDEENTLSDSDDSASLDSTPFAPTDFDRLIDLLINIELKSTDSAERLVKALDVFASKFEDWKTACGRECSKQDRTTQDLLHAIELTDMDAVNAQAVVGLIKISRIKRRIAKDNLYLIPNLNSSLANTLKQAKGLDKRQYSPREFDWNKFK